MGRRWTRSQVTDLAPDAASVRAARKLATPGPWSDTGATDTLVWGKCQGSGWAEGRVDRASKRASRSDATAGRPLDPDAAAKRSAKRMTRMTDGLADFQRWLFDLVGAGLASARQRP